MTLTAVLLISASAVAHALWNWLGKRDNPSAVFFFTANLMGWALPAPRARVRGPQLFRR